jgi:hypothetical protein
MNDTRSKTTDELLKNFCAAALTITIILAAAAMVVWVTS